MLRSSALPPHEALHRRTISSTGSLHLHLHLPLSRSISLSPSLPPSLSLSPSRHRFSLFLPPCTGAATGALHCPAALSSCELDLVFLCCYFGPKTTAFTLPVLERLLFRPKRMLAIRVLVLTPTRELAHQFHSMIEKLAQFTDIRCCLVVGGLSMKGDAELELKAEILLTRVLREKLCHKGLELEQLQAELATSVRGHDILRCENQRSQDAVSSLTHKMKDPKL